MMLYRKINGTFLLTVLLSVYYPNYLFCLFAFVLSDCRDLGEACFLLLCVIWIKIW